MPWQKETILTDTSLGLTASVAVNAPAPNLYTYLARPNQPLAIGQMVQVPFGSRELLGYVMSLGPAPGPGPYKYVSHILKAEPLFGPEFLPLVRFVAQYYVYPIGLCVKEILPGGLSPKFRTMIGFTPLGLEKARNLKVKSEAIMALLESPEKLNFNVFKNRAEIYRLAREGILTMDWEVEVKGVGFDYEFWLCPNDVPQKSWPRLGKIQAQMWAGLYGAPPTPLSHFRHYYTNPLATARSLAEKGLIVLEKKIRDRDDPQRAVYLPSAPVSELTPDQAIALKAISQGIKTAQAERKTRGFLLYGVTGSGKTEIYLRAAEETLALGRGVLWLAPEIALTLGLEGRLKNHFPGENISVLHSALTPGQRHDHWLKLVRGESRLVLGARSAVFAPLVNPGLIIVDEEHDWAFKQDDGLRYQGRDLAAWRARDQGAVLLLGSATPSLESFTAALNGRLELLKLKSRPGQSILPEVKLVDRRRERRNRGPLSADMAEGLTATLARGEQVLLFLNRRGYSHLPLCMACGHIIKCPHCEVSLTLHGGEANAPEEGPIAGTLVCHSCGYQAYPPQNCPACGSPLVSYRGVGTEKLHKMVEKDYQIKALKLDTDSASHKGDLKTILESFAKKEASVLVGTQMAAKGHDFPSLTMVGVVEADLGLNLPDFRAAERTFQLLSQVSGRAGRRDRPGQVIIQTVNPGHYSLVAARDHDYEGFYNQEIDFRRELGYPPFGRLALIRFSGPEEQSLAELAGLAGEMAGTLLEKLNIEGVEILGPAPAPVTKLKDRYRYQLLVKAPDHTRRWRLLTQWLPLVRKSLPKTVILTVDVDPYNMM
jgi:primosomal protein N' (replication factor Y)